MEEERKITVCSVCLQASCWQGLFYCDDYKNAGTIDLPISKLKTLNREHPSYWSEEHLRKHGIIA